MLMLLHLVFDMPDSTDASHAIENALRFAGQHGATQRHAPVLHASLDRARVRRDTA
jgi:hypothetical protein